MPVDSPALRFPLEYNKNLPWVTFFPRDYKFPSASKEDAKGKIVIAKKFRPITLYLPGGVRESLNSDWCMQDVIGGTSDSFTGNVLNELEQLAMKQLGNKLNSSLKSKSGFAIAPTDVLIFSGAEPAPLSFSFEMVPTSHKEAEEIYYIIRSFKQASIPISNLKQSLLQYPLVWDVQFSYGGKPINALGLETPGFYKNMALVGIDISYSSNESSFMVYHDGNPVQVNLTLNFKSMMRHFYTDDETKTTSPFTKKEGALLNVYREN